MFETESTEKVTIETQKKPLIMSGFLGVFWNICSGVSQPVKAPTKDKMPPAVQKEPFCDRNTCTSAAAPEAEKKVLLENFQHLVVQGSKGASRKIHYGTEDHLGSTRMVLANDNLGGTIVKEALVYQPYGAVSRVQGITTNGNDPLRQKFTTKEFDEEGEYEYSNPNAVVELDVDIDNTANLYQYCNITIFYTDGTSEICNLEDPYNDQLFQFKTKRTFEYSSIKTINEIDIVRTAGSNTTPCNKDSENFPEIGKTVTLGNRIQITINSPTVNFPCNYLTVSGPVVNKGIGWYYFGARYYDAEIGLWMAVDPVPQYFNMYSYCGYNPVSRIDPNGEDSYQTNRKLGGEVSFSPLNIASHTFTFTTNVVDGKEVVENTYSWGNRYEDGKGVWVVNAPNDIKAAQMSLENKHAIKVGTELFDKYIDKAFAEIKNSKESKHGWALWNNCKHEAYKLVLRALKIFQSDAKKEK